MKKLNLDDWGFLSGFVVAFYLLFFPIIVLIWLMFGCLGKMNYEDKRRRREKIERILGRND